MQAQTIIAPVRDMGEAVQASLANALGMFLSAIPRIIGFALVLIIGWFVASLIAKGVAALLRAIKFNDLADRSGFAGFVRNTGVRRDSAGVVADLAKWFALLIGVVGALALAAGLAFGLGGRDQAAAMLERARQQAAAAGPKLSRAASAAGDQARAMAEEGRQAAGGMEVSRGGMYSGPERRSTRI